MNLKQEKKGLSMETNESILKRQVLALDTRKRSGVVKDICIDAKKRAVASLIVTSSTTGSSLALPFDKTLAIGDTFITVQESSSMVSTGTPDAKAALADNFKLLGLEVYSCTGNLLGTVQSYEFDNVYGTITKIILDQKTSFVAEQFEFFAPEFVFVNNGEATAEEYRKGKAPRKKAAKRAPAKRTARKTTRK